MQPRLATDDAEAAAMSDPSLIPGEAAERPRRAVPRRVPQLAALVLAVAPLQPIQLMLKRIAERTARSQPEVFARLGANAGKRFLIDPTDLPLALLLSPDPRRPRFTAHRRAALPRHDARISATFDTLLRLLDGTLDADAAFFNREILVTGELEAAVSLRNALDDYRGDLVDDALRSLGVLRQPVSILVRGSRDRRTLRVS